MVKYSILFILLSKTLFGVYDVTKYLENHAFDIKLKDGGLIQISPGTHSFPSYAAKDSYGRNLEIYFYPSWKIQQQLAVQQLFEVLGVPTKLRYPTIIRLNGKLQSAMVSPYVERAKEPQTIVDSLDVSEMAARTKMLLTFYLLGVAGFETIPNSDGLVINDTYLPFIVYSLPSNKRPKLNSYLRNTKVTGTPHVPNLQDIDTQSRSAFLLEMSLYFRKLAALTSQDSKGESLLLKIFESYISNNTNPLEKISTNLGPYTPLRSLFQEKAENLQHEFESFLKEQVKGAFAVEPIRWIDYGDAKPVSDFLLNNPIPFLYNAKQLPNISDPKERRKNAKSTLLRWVLTNDNTREFAISEWKKQIAPLEEHPIDLLMQEAYQYDNSLTLVTGEKWPKIEDLKNTPPLKQYSLNLNVPKTLAVVTPYEHADKESQLIADIINNVGPKLNIELYDAFSPALLNGSQRGLEFEDHAAIAKYAKNNHYSRVLVIEMGDHTDNEIDVYKKNEIELIHLDHHGRKHNKFSAGEQFINLIGYQPSLYEITHFIFDRSYIWGVSDLLQENLPDTKSRFSYIKNLFLISNADTEKLWRWYPHLENRDDIILDLTGYKMNAKHSVFEVALGFFPAHFSIYREDLNGMTRFWGEPEVVQSIANKYKQVIWGGDLNRQAYFIAPPQKSDAKFSEKIRKDVQNHPAIKNLCWETLAKK